MLRINDIKLPICYNEEDIRDYICKKLKIGIYDILSFFIIRESVDARKKGEICKSVSVAVSLRGEKRF